MKAQPLTPPDCDLRDCSWMPLDVTRLRDSDLVVLASGDAFRAAVMLWCASWHQVPAASLPKDDRLLANRAGFGRDLKSWEAIKDDALRGFIECADGRLYHPVVAKKAIEAKEQRQKQKERTKAAANARRNGNRDIDRNDQCDDQCHDNKPPERDDGRDVQRNEVQQTLPNQTLPIKAERESPTEAKQEPSAAPPGSLSEVSKPVLKKPSLEGLGSHLPEEWTPDEELFAEVIEQFGMTEPEVKAETYAFHAYHAANNSFSANWRASFLTWCKRWKEHRDKQAKPRVELSNAKPFVPTEADWEKAIALFQKNESLWPRWAGNNPSSGKVPKHLLEKHGWDGYRFRGAAA